MMNIAKINLFLQYRYPMLRSNTLKIMVHYSARVLELPTTHLNSQNLPAYDGFILNILSSNYTRLH